MAGMSSDLGRDVPGSEKLYVRELWADSSFPILSGGWFLFGIEGGEGGFQGRRQGGTLRGWEGVCGEGGGGVGNIFLSGAEIPTKNPQISCSTQWLS